MRTKSNKEMIRYIYILDVDNRGKKGKGLKYDRIYYTGSTNDIKRRLNEHLLKINGKYLKKCFPEAKKKLVYVDYVYGSEADLLKIEYYIKPKSREYKEKLINSERNKLKLYIPNKCIVLKKYENEKEDYLIRL